MKTIENHYRKQLEREILTAICSRPDYLNSFEFWVSDFMDNSNKQVFEAVKKLREINQPVSLVTLSEYVGMDRISNLFGKDIFDLDSLKEFTEAAKKLREDTVKHLITNRLEQSIDSYEFIQFVENLRDAGIAYAVQPFEKEFEAYEEEYRRVKELQDKGESIGILTDWKEFNSKVALMPHEFTVIGARPSVGKTAFALNLAIQAASYKQKVLFVSLEMTRQSIFDRIFANLTCQNSWKFRYAKVNLDFVRQEMAAIKDYFFFVYAPTATTELVANLSAKTHYDMVVVDYLQLLNDKGSKGENEALRLGRVSKALHGIAAQQKCVVVSPSQLNRDSEKSKREPTLADLRDSGAIEQDADNVLLLHREDRESVEAKLIIAKQRNGALGTLNFFYNPSQNIFKEGAKNIYKS